MRHPLDLLPAVRAQSRGQVDTPVPYVGRGWSLPWAGRNDAESNLRAMGSVGTLFAIVNRNSKATARVNWHLWRKSPTGKKEDREEVTSHAALDIWNRPNRFFTRSLFVETFQQHRWLVGESWWVVARHPAMRSIPLELWPVRPDRMFPVPDPKKYLAGYVYVSPDGERVSLELDEVIQIRTPNPVDPYRGIGPVQTIKADLEGVQLSAEWNRNFFLNSAEPGGIVEVDRRLSDDEYNEMVTRWREQHQGTANAHRVAMLEGGAKWVDRKYTMRDMQFAELRGVSDKVIRGAYAMPKFALGDVDDVNRCHDDQTEVLTGNGWKHFEKVEDDDLIATVNPATRLVEYHRPFHRFAYDYSGPMVRINNRLVDVKVTPNHVMLYGTDNSEGWRIAFAGNFADGLISRFNVMMAVRSPVAIQDRPEFVLPAVEYANGHVGRGDEQLLPMDPWLEFLGWVISEGGILSEERAGGRYVMTLAQKKYPQRIRDCLAQLPFTAHEYDGGNGLVRWNITGKGLIAWIREHVGTNCHDKRIPRWCFDLSERQRRILLDAMMAGDGSYDTRPGRTSCSYATSSPDLADDVMEFAFRLGYRVTMGSHQDPRPNRARSYRVQMSQRPTARVMDGDVTTEHYEGKVYSFEVPNHVYVTRRNGRIGIHGNSTAEASMVWYAEQITVPELEDIKHALNFGYLPMFGATSQGLEFDFESPVPADREADNKERESKATTYETLTRAGVDHEDAAMVAGLPPMRRAVVLTAPPSAPAPAPPAARVHVHLDRPADPRPRRALPARAPAPVRPRNAEDLPPEELPDVAPVLESWEDALGELLADWEDVTAGQRDALIGQVREAIEAGDLEALSRLEAPAADAQAALLAAMVALAAIAAQQAADEADAQEVEIEPVEPEESALAEVAAVTAALLAVGLATSAAAEAMRVAVPGRSGGEEADRVAGAVREHLEDLTDAQPRQHLGAALHSAQHAGRRATFEAAEEDRALPSVAYYGQERNDDRRCGPCGEVDGRWLGNTYAAALSEYPGGAYVRCKGGSRCRGQVVAVWRGGEDREGWLEKEPA